MAFSLITVFVVLIWALPLAAQPAFVSACTQTGLLTTVASFSCTAAGSNRIAVLVMSYQDASQANLSTATYGGAATTEVFTVQSSPEVLVQMRYQLAPSLSPQTVQYDWDAAINAYALGVFFFTGVHQGTPVGTPNEAIGADDNVSVIVSSASGELVIDGAVADSEVFFTGAGPGQTERWRTTAEMTLGVSTEPGAASTTMSWAESASAFGWATGGVALKPAAVSMGTARRRFTALPLGGGIP